MPNASSKRTDQGTGPIGPCGQCGKPSVVSVQTVSLCVDCWYKFEVARTLAMRINAIGMNFAAAQLDSISGLGSIALTPRMQVPDLPKGPMILHNIKIDNSVVGTVNTGNVQSIDVSLTYLDSSGNSAARNALKSLTEAILGDKTLSDVQKNELIGQVAFLSEQAVVAAKDRKPAVIKLTMQALAQSATTIGAIASAWQAVQPILRSIFGT